MRPQRILHLLLAALIAASFLAASDADIPKGQRVFLDKGCDRCHSVSTAGIARKSRSPKTRAPNLVGLGEEYSAGVLAGYLKEGPRKGEAGHPLSFKGSDEELQALIDWLLEQR